MAFNTALSGLQAAAASLNVTGNNIANASTTGFKASVAEFGDVYANSVLGGGSNAIGNGVALADVEQNFAQGNLSFTSNALDLAINGNGFFIVSSQGQQLYTRNGAFGVDNTGNLVDNSGAILQGFPASASGAISGQLANLRVVTDNLPPIQTTDVNGLLNLDSREVPPAVTPFDPTDQNTYNHATSISIFDSQGNDHVMTKFFVKNQANPAAVPPVPENQWTMYIQIDGRDVGRPGATVGPPTTGGTAPSATTTPTRQSFTVNFTEDGALSSTDPATMVIDGWVPVDANGNYNGTELPGADDALPATPPTTSNFTIDLSGTTQFGSVFAVNDINQNGFATGLLTGVDIAGTGGVFARYTNGQSRLLGQVGLANFSNVEGLSPQGNTQWAETFDSGNPVVGTPGSASLGVLQSGALEESNVDLSAELVSLILAQRNYQANARAIETESAVTQAILQIR